MMKELNMSYLKSEDINKLIFELEKAKSNYYEGDTTGALKHLEKAEEILSECKYKINRELGTDGYDAVFIESAPVKHNRRCDAVFIK